MYSILSLAGIGWGGVESTMELVKASTLYSPTGKLHPVLGRGKISRIAYVVLNRKFGSGA